MVARCQNLGQFHKSLKDAKGKGRVSGFLQGKKIVVEVEELAATVAGYPITARGEVALEGKTVSSKDLLLSLGDNQLNVNGTVNDRVNLNWTLEAQNLAQLSPKLEGAARGNGTLQSSIDGKDFVFDIKRLSSEMQGYPLEGSGLVVRQGDAFLIKACCRAVRW